MQLRAPFCPRCSRPLAESERCPGCGLEFVLRGALVDCIGAGVRETRAAEVESFYSVSPFPGYAPGDDAAALLDRSRRSPFLASLDAALSPEARLLDCGCGTAQVAAFLALAGPQRRVVAVDGCRASLEHAEEFRERARIDNLQLVRGDLFDLPVERAGYDVVLSRGVVHHTPDPDAAIARVAECVAPGGTLLLGFYETWARAFHRLRRVLGRVRGQPIAWLDPLLRSPDLDDEKKRIWADDQYRHPLERILPLPHVLRTLRALDLRWVRSVPPAVSGSALFEPVPEPSAATMASLRAGWALRGIRDPDAGLVFVVARRA